jgi:hypothetical protein
MSLIAERELVQQRLKDAARGSSCGDRIDALLKPA